MKSNGRFFVEAFVDKLHGNHEIERFLSHQWGESVKKCPSSFDPAALLSQKKALAKIHYSWFLPFFESMPKESIEPFLTVITPTQAKGIAAHYQLIVKPISLPYFSRLFLIHLLKNKLLDSDALPIDLLPENSLNVLLTIPWNYLIHVIDFLGTYDLAAEMKVIIDNQIISNVMKALSKDQQKFLGYVTKTPIKWYSPKIGLKCLKGDPHNLKMQIHQRGLIRFANALRSLDESTRWHILHRLDTGRASVISKTLKTPLEEKIQAMLFQQVEKVLGMMQT